MPLPSFERVIPYVSRIEAEQINGLFDEVEKTASSAIMPGYLNVETISATRALVDTDTPVQRLTPSGADRDVTLPTVGTSNHLFMISNPTGTSYSLVVKTGATTLAILGPGASGLFASNGAAWQRVGRVKQTTVVITANSTFTKAGYPGLYVARARLAGGGGGGGGVIGSATAAACGNGGGGGEYAEKLILAADLPASVNVTIGAGGSAGAAGNNAGGNGGTTSFGTIFSAAGGIGGGGQAATPTAPFTGSTTGGTGGTGGTGTADLRVPGSDSIPGAIWTIEYVWSSIGGGNPLAPPTRLTTGTTTDENGASGRGYGGGGSGGRSSSDSNNRAGGAGAAGVCIIEIFEEVG